MKIKHVLTNNKVRENYLSCCIIYVILVLEGGYHMVNSTERDIKRLQDNLLVIRKIAGWTTTELGELIGVTKQTINNIESGRSKLSKTQYIAIRTILEYEIYNNPDNVALKQVVSILLDVDDISEEDEKKIKDTMTFVSGAAKGGLDNAAILAGMSALFGAFGYKVGGATGATMGILQGTKWVAKLMNSNRKAK